MEGGKLTAPTVRRAVNPAATRRSFNGTDHVTRLPKFKTSVATATAGADAPGGAESVVEDVAATEVVGLSGDRQISNGSGVGASTSVQLKTTVEQKSNDAVVSAVGTGGTAFTALEFRKIIVIGQSDSVVRVPSTCKHLKRYDCRRRK